MQVESSPNSDYTRTWSPSEEIEFAKLADGTRLRYLKLGSGPTALILLHTVRTQLDQFQLVIPKILHAFTVYAIDMPGMGWSDITPGAITPSRHSAPRSSSSSRRWTLKMSRWQASQWVRRYR
jgi:pimeloyl-ACP methyl ester carboxylesterase